jgi:hypothetical protein
MIKNKTVIVVGAGASKEVNLPTGNELMQIIAHMLNININQSYQLTSGDNIIGESIRIAAGLESPRGETIDQYIQAAWRIRDAMPQSISIDNFLDAHQEDKKLVFCGKLAIVRAILQAERSSLLYYDTRNRDEHMKFPDISSTWFASLFRLLTENCRPDQIEERFSHIEFVVFNYDRCLEHFLHNSLMNYYGFESEKAAEVVCKIKVFHPYGTVGTLPWCKSDKAINYGAIPSSEQLIDLARQINTFTEGTDPKSSEIINIRQSIAKSTIVLFLGFAYHRQSLEIIQNREKSHYKLTKVHYYGTALGISKSDCDVIRERLSELEQIPEAKIILRNELTCTQLFNEYWRSLSLY